MTGDLDETTATWRETPHTAPSWPHTVATTHDDQAGEWVVTLRIHDALTSQEDAEIFAIFLDRLIKFGVTRGRHG